MPSSKTAQTATKQNLPLYKLPYRKLKWGIQNGQFVNEAPAIKYSGVFEVDTHNCCRKNSISVFTIFHFITVGTLHTNMNIGRTKGRTKILKDKPHGLRGLRIAL